MSDKKKFLQPQKNGVHEWSPFMNVLLNEILWHKGLPFTPPTQCVLCELEIETPIRCMECFDTEHSIFCLYCVCQLHVVNPFHIVKVIRLSVMLLIIITDHFQRCGTGLIGTESRCSLCLPHFHSPPTTVARPVLYPFLP